MTERQPIRTMVALSLEDRLGGTDNGLPLHVTITPPFNLCQSDTSLFLYQSDEIAASAEKFEVIGKEEDTFDHYRVRLIGGATIIALHEAYLPVVLAYDPRIDRTYTGESYQPHSTYCGRVGVAQGERMLVDAVTIYQKTNGVWQKNHESKMSSNSKVQIDGVIVVNDEDGSIENVNQGYGDIL